MAMCASFGSNTLSESMTFVLTVEVGSVARHTFIATVSRE